MCSQGIDLKFVDFTPDSVLWSDISKIVEKMHFSAPSDSITRIAFLKTKNSIKASCQIISQAGTFMSDTVSENALSALMKAEYNIRQQLVEWKSHRFDHEFDH